MSLKVLHSADFHAQDKDIEEIQKCLFHMVDKAIEENPDIIIIAGDLFESYMVKLDSLSVKLIFEVVSNLADIAPVAIMLGTKSHEGSATEVLRHINAKFNVWVSDRPEQLYLIDKRKLTNIMPQAQRTFPVTAVVSMMPTPTKKFFQSDSSICETDQEISKALTGIFAGFGAKASEFDCPHILAGHLSIGGAYISETQTLIGVDIEITKDQIALANAYIVCLGHIHMQQKIEPNIFYSGSIYRKNWGELEEKGFYIHDIIGYGANRNIESIFHLTPTRKLVKISADMTAEGVIGGKILFYDDYSKEELENALLRIEIKVYQDEVEKIDQQNIKDVFNDSGVIETEIRLIRIPRENVRSQKILQLNSLPDKLEEQAKIKDETLSQSIIDKAIDLGSKDPNEIIKAVSSGTKLRNEIETKILYCGKEVFLSCDGNCDKAFGMNFQGSKKGIAPKDPRTYEGGHAKPVNGKHNRWCARECERSNIKEANISEDQYSNVSDIAKLAFQHNNLLKKGLK